MYIYRVYVLFQDLWHVLLPIRYGLSKQGYSWTTEAATGWLQASAYEGYTLSLLVYLIKHIVCVF